jgi:hypothetical protein
MYSVIISYYNICVEGAENVWVSYCYTLVHVHVMKERGGVYIQLHSFLTLALDGVTTHLHAPTVLPLGKETPVPIEWQGR